MVERSDGIENGAHGQLPDGPDDILVSRHPLDTPSKALMTSPPRVVVIVDDDVSFREALAGLVAAFGFRATAFHSAEAYLKSSAWQHTACLISDVNMPGLGGFALYDRLAALDARVPTIFVSGTLDRRTRAAALSRGVTGYLAKPVDPGELFRLIRTSIAVDRPPAGS